MDSIAQVDQMAMKERRLNINTWIAISAEYGDDKHIAYLEYTSIAPQAAAMYADVLQERALWVRIEQAAYYG